jgi:polar amino acid transport system substrate-binding protein
MESFLDLLARGYINLKPLITHVIDISDAEKAYDIILGKVKEHHIGILLKYSENENKSRSAISLSNKPLSSINTGFIGAGSFAQSYLIPNVKTSGGSLDGVVTSRGITAKNVGDKFGFNFCSSDINDVLGNEKINTVFIATPHSSHAELVIKSLAANKNVFVEKPLAISIEELDQVIEAKKKNSYPVMVGFNRRFAPISESIKKEFLNTGEPIVINIRVNAGFIPKDNWIQQKDIGAGRIIGEMCHFIDLMQYFTNSEPVKVYADCISSTNDKITPADNIAIVIKFANGSVGNLTYLANGDKSMPKELIEVFSGSKVGIINDFKDGLIYKNGKTIKLKSSGKGHREEVGVFLNALKSGNDSPISFRSICLTTLTTFKIHDSLNTGLAQDIELD